MGLRPFYYHLSHGFIVLKKCRASHHRKKTSRSTKHNQHHSTQDCCASWDLWFGVFFEWIGEESVAPNLFAHTEAFKQTYFQLHQTSLALDLRQRHRFHGCIFRHLRNTNLRWSSLTCVQTVKSRRVSLTLV